MKPEYSIDRNLRKVKELTQLQENGKIRTLLEE